MALGATAFAAIPNADGNIYACYSDGDGSVRVQQDPAKPCPKKWSPLKWAAAQPEVAQPTTYQVREDAVIPAGGADEFVVECDSGDVATGGGYFTPGPDNVYVQLSEPYPGGLDVHEAPTGWHVTLWSNLTTAGAATSAYAVCLDVTP